MGVYPLLSASEHCSIHPVHIDSAITQVRSSNSDTNRSTAIVHFTLVQLLILIARDDCYYDRPYSSQHYHHPLVTPTLDSSTAIVYE